MRAPNWGAHEDQSGLKPYPDAAARRVGKAEKRTSADYPVVQYPVQGAACHLRLSFGQVAGGEMRFSFASMRFQPIAQIRSAFALTGDFGHGQGHDPWMDLERKSVVSGKEVSVRVQIGGRRNIKKKKKHT